MKVSRITSYVSHVVRLKRSHWLHYSCFRGYVCNMCMEGVVCSVWLNSHIMVLQN